MIEAETKQLTPMQLADGSFHKEGLSLPRFLREAAQLSTHLDMHHRIVSGRA